MRSQTVDLGGPVHYVEFGGEGPPLVLVHGLGARGLGQDLLELCCRDTSTVTPELVEAHVALSTERLASMPWSSAAYLEAARSLLGALRRTGEFAQDVKAVRCPTMLVHGVHDRLVRFGYSEALAKLRPDCRFEVFPDAGHVPMLEDPEGFTTRVGTWLEGLGQAPRAVG